MTPKTALPQADTRALAEQVYDMLMARIDSDLLLANLPNLDAQYAGESAEEHESRMQRYRVSYEKFDEAFHAFMNGVNGSVRTAQRSALRQKEEQAVSEEQNTLTSLASAFAALPATADKSAFN